MLLHSWLQRLTVAFHAHMYFWTGMRHQRPLPHGAARVELLEQRLCPSLLGLTTSGPIVTLSQVVDPLHGTVTSVGSSFTASIPGTVFAATEGISALDPVNHRYYFQSLGGAESPLFVVDTQTGNLL